MGNDPNRERDPFPLPLAGEGQGGGSHLNDSVDNTHTFDLDDAHELKPPASVGMSSGLKP
jgi:hypothetical protein